MSISRRCPQFVTHAYSMQYLDYLNCWSGRSFSNDMFEFDPPKNDHSLRPRGIWPSTFADSLRQLKNLGYSFERVKFRCGRRICPNKNGAVVCLFSVRMRVLREDVNGLHVPLMWELLSLTACMLAAFCSDSVRVSTVFYVRTGGRFAGFVR